MGVSDDTKTPQGYSEQPSPKEHKELSQADTTLQLSGIGTCRQMLCECYIKKAMSTLSRSHISICPDGDAYSSNFEDSLPGCQA